MKKTKVKRCAAKDCRTLTVGELCPAHAEKPGQPATDTGALLAAHAKQAEALRAAERSEAAADRAMLREQLHVMGRVGRQPVFPEGRDHV